MGSIKTRTMKKILIILVLGCCAFTGRSQSIVELAEQLVIDGEQLAVMRSTLQELVQGYEQLKNGFTHIRDIVKDNFRLHKTFLDALWVLSPAVRGDPRITGIINTTSRIMAAYRSGGAMVAGSPVFTAQELDYMQGVLSALLSRCNQQLEELTMVTTDDELRMSDEQRIAVLGRIDTETRAENRFIQDFNNTIAVEAARRRKEAGDLHTLKILYGIPD